MEQIQVQQQRMFQADPPNKAGRKVEKVSVSEEGEPDCFKPTHPTRQAGSLDVSHSGGVGVEGNCFKPTHPTRQAGSVAESGYRRARHLGVSSRPTQQGRPEDVDVQKACLNVLQNEFQADPPNKAGRKDALTVDIEGLEDSKVSSRPTQQGRPEVRRPSASACAASTSPVSSRPTQQGRPEDSGGQGPNRCGRPQGFKPTHPTRQAGRR